MGKLSVPEGVKGNIKDDMVEVSWEPSPCAPQYWVKFDCLNGSAEARYPTASPLLLNKADLEDCTQPDVSVAALISDNKYSEDSESVRLLTLTSGSTNKAAAATSF